MELSDLFWNASLDELKRGYIQKKDIYICLLCGEEYEKGIVYPHESLFYEAERYMGLHIEQTHGSVFEYLIGLDKKLTGLTDHQNNLLRLFYQGKSDTEVQKELGIGSASTIRHHRFTLKEKERQARTFLAMMELLKEKDQHAPSFIPVHKTATMVDDRYNITQDEQRKIVEKFFPEGPTGPLTKFPLKQKEKLIVLREIIKHIESERVYTEKELNEILQVIYGDYVMIRRYLIEYGLLDRKPDGSEYWVMK
ncbi:MAG TPA: transcriptional regulator [Paenibacillaceae bacterium]|nr:transcriptional regulator [Paenibacillaceae bacterium]